MSEDGEGWQVARRRKGQTRKTQLQVSLNAESNQENVDVDKTVKRIRQTVCELTCEIFCKKWKGELSMAALAILPQLQGQNIRNSQVSTDHFENCTKSQKMQCVCYGLGSISSCVSARYQLAMLLLLLDAAQIQLKDCSVYDPAFSSGERGVLQEMGLTVLTENEEGKRLADKPTLFYLMHCGKALYNNLLWKNWSVQHLSQMIIVGNSFCGMRDRSIDREFKQDYSYISQVAAVCEERLLPCPSHMTDVFSDTAVITFSSSGLGKLPQSTWEKPPEPQYEHCLDLEIVLKEKDR